MLPRRCWVILHYFFVLHALSCVQHLRGEDLAQARQNRIRAGAAGGATAPAVGATASGTGSMVQAELQFVASIDGFNPLLSAVEQGFAECVSVREDRMGTPAPPPPQHSQRHACRTHNPLQAPPGTHAHLQFLRAHARTQAHMRTHMEVPVCLRVSSHRRCC